MSDAKKEDQSFVGKVISLLKLSDDTKISRFHKKELKHIADQVKVRKDEMEVVDEKLDDWEEEFNDALYSRTE